jgi:hypothetical protein
MQAATNIDPVLEEVVENDGPNPEHVQRAINLIPDSAGQHLLKAAVASASRLKSIIVGPSALADPMVVVIPSLIKQVSNVITFSPSHISLRHLSHLDINLDTPIPSIP